MKKKIIFLFLTVFSITSLFAQPRQHNGNNNRGGGFHGNKKFATTEDGVRIILFANGTWKVAPHQPVRPRFTSQIKGSYLYIYENGQEVNRTYVKKSTKYDFNCKCYNGIVSFGLATYLYNGQNNNISYMGKEVIGKAGQFEDAVYSAAFDFTENVYNGITAQFKGAYLYVYENAQEVERVRVRENSRYDFPTRSYHGSISIGNATYEYNGKDRTIRFLGNNVIGKANSVEEAKFIAAWNYVNRYYGNERFRWSG